VCGAAAVEVSWVPDLQVVVEFCPRCYGDLKRGSLRLEEINDEAVDSYLRRLADMRRRMVVQ